MLAPMRLASYNVENLFSRPKVMAQATWNDGKTVLLQFSQLNRLLGKAKYTAADKAKIVELLVALGLERSDNGPFVLLRRSRGSLLTRPKAGGLTITASGRGDWVGSLELEPEQIAERPILNTARVISDAAPDVLAVVEAEDRPSLTMFNDDILPRVGEHSFRHLMLIDGNDRRGIDVGLMTRDGYPIGAMRSHVDDHDGKHSPIFSRDCPEFTITTPSGARFLLLINHLKSKGYGSKASSDRRRKQQAARVAEIYRARRAEGIENIAVVGDLNDTPDSDPLSPLIDGTDLTEIASHPDFDDGGYPGTYGSCTARHKIDFILLSPEMFARVQAGGINRKGMWPGVRPVKWDKLDEVRREADVASDHALAWADIDL